MFSPAAAIFSKRFKITQQSLHFLQDKKMSNPGGIWWLKILFEKQNILRSDDDCGDTELFFLFL